MKSIIIRKYVAERGRKSIVQIDPSGGDPLYIQWVHLVGEKAVGKNVSDKQD